MQDAAYSHITTSIYVQPTGINRQANPEPAILYTRQKTKTKHITQMATGLEEPIFDSYCPANHEGQFRVKHIHWITGKTKSMIYSSNITLC